MTQDEIERYRKIAASIDEKIVGETADRMVEEMTAFPRGLFRSYAERRIPRSLFIARFAEWQRLAKS